MIGIYKQIVQETFTQKNFKLQTLLNVTKRKWLNLHKQEKKKVAYYHFIFILAEIIFNNKADKLCHNFDGTVDCKCINTD